MRTEESPLEGKKQPPCSSLLPLVRRLPDLEYEHWRSPNGMAGGVLGPWEADEFAAVRE